MFKTASELVSGDAEAPEDNTDSDTLVDAAHYRDASPLLQGLLFFEGRAVFPQVLSKLKKLDPIGVSMLSRSCRACKQVINEGVWDERFRIIDFIDSVERLKWAYNHGFPLTRRILKEEYDFVVNGMSFWYEEDSEFFLDEDGYPREDYIGPADTNVCFTAAKEGTFPVLLEFCRQVAEGIIPCPKDENLINAVACTGRLSILQKLRKLDCPWSATTCAYAAYFNRFDVYKWLRDAGCPYDDRVKVYNPSFVAEVDVFPEYGPYHDLHGPVDRPDRTEYDGVWAATLLRRQHQWIHVIKKCNFAWVDVDGPEALEKGEKCEINWNYTEFFTPVPSDDEEGEEDEDDHWDEDDIDEDDEDGVHNDADDNNNEDDVIGTDAGMIEGEDDYFGLIDYYCDGFVDDDFDGVDLFD